jgi:hypothetical protein
MADLSITAANVVAGTGSTKENGVAGETITAGQALYKDGTTGKWKKADTNSGTAGVRACTGIALNGASDGQPLAVLTKGPITIGATLTAGVAYYLSGTAGGICPVGDLTTGDYPCLLGMATSTTVLNFQPNYSGAALA